MKRSILLAALFGVLAAVGIALADTNRDDLNIFTAGIKLGSSGTQLDDSYAASLTTNFVGVGANACKLSAAITVTGAAAGDVCSVGVPTSETTSLQYTCQVTGTNEAKIKICNPTGAVVASGTNPSTGTYYVRTFDP